MYGTKKTYMVTGAQFFFLFFGVILVSVFTPLS